MKNLLFASLLLAAACGPARTVFHKDETPREAYERRLDRQGIDETPAYRQWKAVAEAALATPMTVTLPYRQSGYFGADKPRALALKLPARQGQRLLFEIGDRSGGTLYAELFAEDGRLLHAADTAARAFDYTVPASGQYVLRLQPAMGAGGRYTLALQAGPSLLFPVAGHSAKPGSFWGADRDGGARKHEGVDIFAPKGTPALAAADGVVTGVAEGGLGGKYVFLRPAGSNYNLYYAHLDQQLVHVGQEVKAGTPVGLVGNTGNARTTPSHLHFGIYGNGGAVDPYPFINRAVAAAGTLPVKTLPAALKVKSGKAGKDSGLPANTVLAPLGWTASGWIAELPDGRAALLPFSTVQAVNANS